MTFAITDGDDFKNWFVEEVRDKCGLNLETKLSALDSGPKLDFDEANALLLKKHGISYEISVPKIESGLLIEGLACLYGYGICKYNYDVAGFQELPEEELDNYKRLALELWDRNIHIDWMRSNKYLLHNGTKDLKFCKHMAKREFDKGIELHSSLSKIRVDIDTDHHSLSFEEFSKDIDSNIIPLGIDEILLDQASVTGRWYRKYETYASDHAKTQKEFQDKGIIFKKDNKPINWKNPLSRPHNTAETDIWSKWLEANTCFAKYWIKLFGKHDKLWNPPISFSELARLSRY